MNQDGFPFFEDRLRRTQPVPEQHVFFGQTRPVVKCDVRGAMLFQDQAIQEIEGRRGLVKIKKMRAAVRSLGPDAKDELGDDAELPLGAEQTPEVFVPRVKLQGLARRQDNARRDGDSRTCPYLKLSIPSPPVATQPATVENRLDGVAAVDSPKTERRPRSDHLARLDPGREFRGVDLE